MKSPRTSHLSIMEVGRYRPGLFYSEGISADPFDFSIFTGVGKNIHATVRAIVLLHETAHLVHDLSLGACLNRDFFLDEAANSTFRIVRDLAKHGLVKLPLNQVSNDALIEQAGLSNTLEEIKKHTLNTVEDDADINGSTATTTSAHGKELEKHSYNLTEIDLLEGIVATKTVHSLAARAVNSDERQYLAEIINDIPLLPDNLPNRYGAARQMFDQTAGAAILGESPTELSSWLYDKNDGISRHLLDTGFLYLADIALHIPPTEVIDEMLTTGSCDEGDFEPTTRFAVACNILRQHDFPAIQSKDSNQYYVGLFDWVAELAGWPDFEHTQAAWEAKLAYLRDEKRRSISDGYRYRMLVHRRLDASATILGDSISACSAQAIPILHLTRRGLREIGTYGNIFMPLDLHREFPVWQLMQFEAVNWESSNELDVELGYERRLSFLQEVVVRVMCRHLQATMLDGTHFDCPWLECGCEASIPQCKSITCLSEIPDDECSLRRFLAHHKLPIEQIYWEYQK